MKLDSGNWGLTMIEKDDIIRYIGSRNDLQGAWGFAFDGIIHDDEDASIGIDFSEWVQENISEREWHMHDCRGSVKYGFFVYTKSDVDDSVYGINNWEVIGSNKFWNLED